MALRIHARDGCDSHRANVYGGHTLDCCGRETPMLGIYVTVLIVMLVWVLVERGDS